METCWHQEEGFGYSSIDALLGLRLVAAEMKRIRVDPRVGRHDHSHNRAKRAELVPKRIARIARQRSMIYNLPFGHDEQLVGF